jgi:hypothetical protein
VDSVDKKDSFDAIFFSMVYLMHSGSKQKEFMTIRQHRIIQWIAITLILSVGAGWYYRVKVQGAQTTIISESPSFQADLKNTLDLQAGVGVPTYSRSDTANYSATVTDFEGLIKPVKNGEARFEVARRVENLLTNTGFNGTLGSGNVPTDYVRGFTTGTVTLQTSSFGGNSYRM